MNIIRQEKSVRVKRISGGKLFSHQIKVSAQIVFSWKHVHAWEMIHSLKLFKSNVFFLRHSSVGP